MGSYFLFDIIKLGFLNAGQTAFGLSKLFYGDINNTVQEIGSGGGSGMTACAKSFSGSVNKSSSNITITLDRNDYSIIFIYVNIGSVVYSSTTVDISKTTYICNNDNTNMVLASTGIADTFVSRIYVKMNGDTVTFTLSTRTTGSTTATASIEGVLLAL